MTKKELINLTQQQDIYLVDIWIQGIKYAQKAI